MVEAASRLGIAEIETPQGASFLLAIVGTVLASAGWNSLLECVQFALREGCVAGRALETAANSPHRLPTLRTVHGRRLFGFGNLDFRLAWLLVVTASSCRTAHVVTSSQRSGT